jgi:hypothetical protein
VKKKSGEWREGGSLVPCTLNYRISERTGGGNVNHEGAQRRTAARRERERMNGLVQ